MTKLCVRLRYRILDCHCEGCKPTYDIDEAQQPETMTDERAAWEAASHERRENAQRLRRRIVK